MMESLAWAGIAVLALIVVLSFVSTWNSSVRTHRSIKRLKSMKAERKAREESE